MKHLKLFRLLAFSAFLLTQHSLRAQDVPTVAADTLSTDTTWKLPSWNFEVEVGSYISSDVLSFDEPSSPTPAVGIVISHQFDKASLSMFFRAQGESESFSRGSWLGSANYSISPARSFSEFGVMAGVGGAVGTSTDLRLNCGLAYTTYTTRGALISSSSRSTSWFFGDDYTNKVYVAKTSESLAIVVDASLALRVLNSVSLGAKVCLSQSFDDHNCMMMMFFSRLYL